MKVRLVYKEDGNVSIIYPTVKSKKHNETEEEWLNRTFSRATPKNSTFVDIEESQIPADRTFREAWELDSDTIKVNVEKAREIHMDKIRKVRDEKLAKLDVEFIIALESEDLEKQKEVSDKKRALRDIPQTFDLSVANTIEELKGLWPNELQ